MKIWGLSLALLLTVFVVGVSAQEKAEAYMGSYEGLVMSGGEELPITTSFSISKNGDIRGSYLMQEPDGDAEGTLTFVTEEGPFVALFEWEDKYGKGSLRLLFASDGSGFTGYWGDSEDTCLELWTGKK